MTIDKPRKYQDKFATLAIHAGEHEDVHGSVIEPISLSTTFKQYLPGSPVGEFEYSRSQNPNRKNFENALAALENGKLALSFSSGVAAIAVVIQTLPRGSHVISLRGIYGGTHTILTDIANAYGIEVSFTNNLIDDVESLAKENTKLVWVETPSNPTLNVNDLNLLSNKIREINIKNKTDIKLAADNTFSSPYLCNPLKYGVDIVVHSATKYINGHSDVIIGAVITNEREIFKKIQFLQNAIGAIPSPFDCWLAHRGLKTLHLRVRQASISAQKIAELLQASKHVISVNYPGLKSHPNHKVTLKQHRDGLGGAMLSFRINGGASSASKFAQYLRLFATAKSLGGIESLVEVSVRMTYGAIPKKERETIGIFDDLIRLSVGIEDTDDLLKDIQQALKHADNSDDSD